MDKICLPTEWFAVICCIILILFISVVILSIALFKMKMKQYQLLQDQIESNIVTTINSNRFNIQLPDRKSSDHLLRVYAQFNNDQANAQINVVGTASNEKANVYKVGNTTELTEQPNIEDKSKDKTKVVLPPLIMKHEMEQLCEELLRSQKIKKKQDISYKFPETNRAQNRSVLINMRAISMSTPDLDIYDVLPNNTREKALLNNDIKLIENQVKETEPLAVTKTNKDEPINVRERHISENNIYDVLPRDSGERPTNVYVDDDGEYSHPKTDTKVIVDDDSGYLLPLSFNIEYVNAN